MEPSPVNKPVPQIPLLKGEENLQDWKQSLIETIEFYGMKKNPSTSDTTNQNEHLSPDASDAKIDLPFELITPADKAFVLGLISASVGPVLAQLTDAGWTNKKTDRDPGVLYRLIVKLFAPLNRDRARRIASHLRQLTQKPATMKLRTWLGRIEVAKYHLDKERVHLDDSLAILLVLDALDGQCNPNWHDSLLREKNAGKLSRNRLMSKISAKARQDEIMR